MSRYLVYCLETCDECQYMDWEMGYCHAINRDIENGYAILHYSARYGMFKRIEDTRKKRKNFISKGENHGN